MIDLLALAAQPLLPLAPDGPAPRAMLANPAQGVVLRAVFRRGRIVLQHPQGLGVRPGRHPLFVPKKAVDLTPNWKAFGDILDPDPTPPGRTEGPEALAGRLQAALDAAIGPGATALAMALGHLAGDWGRAQGMAEPRELHLRPEGSVVLGGDRLDLPGGASWARAAQGLRTQAAGRGLVPALALIVPGDVPSAHRRLERRALALDALAAARADAAALACLADPTRC